MHSPLGNAVMHYWRRIAIINSRKQHTTLQFFKKSRIPLVGRAHNCFFFFYIFITMILLKTKKNIMIARRGHKRQSGQNPRAALIICRVWTPGGVLCCFGIRCDNHSSAFFAVCLGSLSCWKLNELPMFSVWVYKKKIRCAPSVCVHWWLTFDNIKLSLFSSMVIGIYTLTLCYKFI